MDNAYKSLSSKVYDFDKPIGKSFGDIEFYKQILSSVKGKVLEPACGNGRILVPLYNAGVDIEGFDLSEDMLKSLKEYTKRESLPINVWKDDMTAFQTESTYDAIIMPAGSFLLLNQENAARKALNRFNEVLNPQGKLYIDIYLCSGIQVGDTDVRTFHFDSETKVVLKMEVTDHDPKENVFTSTHVYKKYHEDTVVEEEIEQFPLKFYTLQLFENLLHESGFSNVVIHENYNNTATDATTLYTFEATKS